LWTAELRIEVSQQGLHVRFFPFHLRPRTIDLESIESVQAVTYSPLRDYGGWGIRYGPGSKAYNVSGDKGVILHFKNGKRLLLGSQRHEALAAAIQAACR
jgi:hypothetical protein